MLPLPASPSVFLKWISTFCSLVTCQLLEPSTVWMSDFWTLDQTCVTQVRYGPRGGWWGVLNHSRISYVGRCVILYIKKKLKMNKYQVWGNKSQITTYNISLLKQINRHEFVAVHGFNSSLLTILQVISPLLKNLFSNPWALTQAVSNTGAFRCVQEWYVSDAPSAH